MDNLKYYDRIQDYLNQQLSEADQLQFETELTTNKELKLEYDAAMAAQKAITVLGYQKIRRNLAATATSTIAEKPIIKKTTRRHILWAAAAIILLLVTALIVQLLPESALTHKEIAQNNFEAPNLTTIRNSSDNQSPLKIAAIAYDKGAYLVAINTLKDLPAESPLFGDAQFISGCAYLKLNKATAAIPAFQNATLNSRFSEKAAWNLIIATIQKGDTAQAIQLLQQMQKEEGITTFRKMDIQRLLTLLQ